MGKRVKKIVVKKIVIENSNDKEEVSKINHIPMHNYSEYVLNRREKVMYYSLGIIFFFLVGHVFYNSVIVSILLTSLSFLFVKNIKKDLLAKEKTNIKIQFKEGIYAISSALNAGYSIERSFQEAVRDLKLIYIDSSTPIINEFEIITRKVEMNIPIETVLMDFAIRSEIDDIKDFAEVFVTCKRTGGDIIKVIKDTSKNIAEKIEINREIELVIAAKKFEQKIMSIIPFGIILYLRISNPGFLDIMYSTIMGNIIMTVCVLIYYISYRLGNKIINIKV